MNIPRHESVDHVHPTDGGLMNDPGDEVPGTGIAGDETLVKSTGEGPPGIVPGPAAGTGSDLDPGPTPESAWDQAQQKRASRRD